MLNFSRKQGLEGGVGGVGGQGGWVVREGKVFWREIFC